MVFDLKSKGNMQHPNSDGCDSNKFPNKYDGKLDTAYNKTLFLQYKWNTIR